MEVTHCIYKHTNKINGKIYIGQTKMKPQYRWGKEGNGYKTQKIYEDIKKYGWDNFTHEIIEDNLSDAEVDKREDYWINFYNSYYPNGYNLISSGGNITQKTRDNMSQSAKKAWANASQKRREQQRQIMIKVNKTTDRSGVNNSMYGTHRHGTNAGNRKSCGKHPITKEPLHWKYVN